MSNLVALHNHAHQSLKVNTQLAEAQGGNLHMVPVVLSEFLKLAVQFPIVFTKNKDTGRFSCITLFGFQANENLFVKNGEWDSLYIPLQIRRQPFFLGNSSEVENEFVICIDTDHKSLQSDIGEQVFDTTGKETPYLENIKSILAELMNGEASTDNFVKTLAELNLLQPMRLEITFKNEESMRVDGLYTINEDRLKTLEIEAITQLHQKNYLSAIYTMITSTGHIYGLIERKNKQLSGN